MQPRPVGIAKENRYWQTLQGRTDIADLRRRCAIQANDVLHATFAVRGLRGSSSPMHRHSQRASSGFSGNSMFVSAPLLGSNGLRGVSNISRAAFPLIATLVNIGWTSAHEQSVRQPTVSCLLQVACTSWGSASGECLQPYKLFRDAALRPEWVCHQS